MIGHFYAGQATGHRTCERCRMNWLDPGECAALPAPLKGACGVRLRTGNADPGKNGGQGE